MALPLEGIRIADLSWSGRAPTRRRSWVTWAPKSSASNRFSAGTVTPATATSPPISFAPTVARPAADAQMWDLSSNQNSVGRNKKNVTMDLTRPEGREVFFRLIAKSDVFVENNQPELLDHLGVGTDRLFEANPRLIVMRMPGFGLNGPYSSFRAFGANMEAMMGHALLRGYTDTDPSMISPSFLRTPAPGRPRRQQSWLP